MTELERRLGRGPAASAFDADRLSAELQARAEAEGLLDVAYAHQAARRDRDQELAER